MCVDPHGRDYPHVFLRVSACHQQSAAVGAGRLLGSESAALTVWRAFAGWPVDYHQVTRSWPDASTKETINNWCVSLLDAIATNIQLIVTVHRG